MKYEDDLMYASEAIQKIASEAMQRVENLYKLRFSLPTDPEPTANTRSRKPQIESIGAPEKIDTTFDLVDNFMHEAPKAATQKVKPNLQSALNPTPVTTIDQRPEKIDSNLHGLTL